MRHTWCDHCRYAIENNDDVAEARASDQGVCAACWGRRKHYCGCGHRSYDSDLGSDDNEELYASEEENSQRPGSEDPDADADIEEGSGASDQASATSVSEPAAGEASDDEDVGAAVKRRKIVADCAASESDDEVVDGDLE